VAAILAAATLTVGAVPADAGPAISTVGDVWAWGKNSSGELGDGTTTYRLAPVKIGFTAMAVDAGDAHTVALQPGGTYGWGSNVYQQVGDGTPIDRLVPTRVQGYVGSGWTSVSAGAYHSVGLDGEGNPYAWGSDQDGQVATYDPLVPHSVQGPWWSGYLQGLKWIDAGRFHTTAVSKSGRLYAWGSNTFGQLGNGTTMNQRFPVQIGDETTWSSTSGGNYHTLALRSDGSLWAWGDNTSGQLGDGTTVTRLAPRYISGGWMSISAGYYHSFAIKSDGSLWAWGANDNGQLGDGTTTSRLQPTRIGTSNDWAAVSASLNHTVALKKDGSLWAWGDNSAGQLGDGTKTRRLQPTRIGTGNDWLSVSAGWSFTVAIRKTAVTPPPPPPDPTTPMGELAAYGDVGRVVINGWHYDVRGGDWGTPIKFWVVGVDGWQEDSVGGNDDPDPSNPKKAFSIYRTLPPGTYEVCAAAFYYGAYHPFGCVSGVVVRAS
jgi:alpha-tubulin suppressor-like RCC1 family protein